MIIPTRTVPPEIEKELAISLYRWAIGDAEREVSQDFPLVRPIQNTYAFGFLAYCATLSQQDQMKISRAMVGFSHPIALAYLGETMTPEEQHAILESYKAQYRSGNIYTEKLNARFGPDSVYSTKAEVLTVLKKAMRSAFGERCPSRYKVVSTYENDFSQGTTQWRLETRISILDKRETLRYTQSLFMPAHDWALTTTHPSHRATGILGWLGILGISPLPTYWDIPFADDVEQAVASLALVCEHYLRAVPGIIEGLSL